jgi:hypothetical protein
MSVQHSAVDEINNSKFIFAIELKIKSLNFESSFNRIICKIILNYRLKYILTLKRN